MASAPSGLPTEDLVYLLITLTGVAALVLELAWWLLTIWVAASMASMIRIETNSREIRHHED